MTVEAIRNTVKVHFPGMVLGYDDGFGFVLGTPAPRKAKNTKGDYRAEIDQMITPCHICDRMTPQILIGGSKKTDLNHIGQWLKENVPADCANGLGLPSKDWGANNVTPAPTAASILPTALPICPVRVL